MKTKLLGVACIALTLGACAAPMSSRPDPLALQNAVSDNPEKGVLIVDTAGNLGCDSTTISMIGVPSGFVSMTDYRAKESGPAVRVVDPGKYRVLTGRCTVPGYYPANLPNLMGWFGFIEVEAGETVYAGTLDTNRVDVKSKLEGLGAAWSALISFSTKEQSTYITYELLDRSETLKAAMKAGEMGEGMAEIADRMVYKPPLKVMDKAEYEGAITRAYGKTAEGKTPTKAQVDERFSKEMEIAIDNSMRKLGAQMGLSPEEVDEMLSIKPDEDSDTDTDADTGTET